MVVEARLGVALIYPEVMAAAALEEGLALVIVVGIWGGLEARLRTGVEADPPLATHSTGLAEMAPVAVGLAQWAYITEVLGAVEAVEAGTAQKPLHQESARRIHMLWVQAVEVELGQP